MIDKFVKAWDANNKCLSEYLRTHKMNEYSDYCYLVEHLFKKVINPYLEKNLDSVFDTNRITVIDDGDWQGCQLFLIPRDTYQPSETDYVMTHSYYGSCSGCDTILSITKYESNQLPNEDQVSEFMQLCLHLLQRCIYPYT